MRSCVLAVAGMSREILALNMHPMQKAVSAEELYKAAERALVTVTCQVKFTHVHMCKIPCMPLVACMYNCFLKLQSSMKLLMVEYQYRTCAQGVHV